MAATPLWTGPDHYDRLRDWCRENGREIGPNGSVSAVDSYEFWQAENRRRAEQRVGAER